MKPARQERSAQVLDDARVQRLREDAARPMSVSLAEGIALSHKLLRFAGAASTACAKQ